MELKEITSSKLDEFVLNSDKSHFMQTSAWGEVAKTRAYIPHFLGLFDGDEIKASALLLEKKVLNYSTFYCPRGFILDYSNKEIIKEMVKQIKAYSLKHNGLYVKINPDIIIRKLDENANPIYTNEYNLSLVDYFQELGGKFRGFTTKFTESSAPRFTFRVDVNKSDEELFNSLHNTTKKIIKENNPYNILITKNDSNALDDFYKVMKQTSIRKKLYIESFDYFKNFFELLNKNNEADIYVASVETNDLKKVFEEKLKYVDKEITDVNNRPDGPKKENKLKDLDSKKNKIFKLKKEIDELTEERIVLSSIITAKFSDKVWTIHGGNSDELLFLNANYELYYHILKDSRDNGYKIVDFYGSEGVVDKDSPIYGIFLFKLRFGGDFDEFVGEYDFVTKPFINKIISTLLYIRRRILYRISIRRKSWLKK